MDPVSLGLAVIGTLDLCVKYGDKLVKFCREQHRVRADVEELALTIEAVWVKTKVQLELLKTVLDSDSMVVDLCAHYLHTVKQLESKITAAVMGLGIIDRRSLGLSGLKLPIDIRGVYLKRALQDVVKDLEDWQRRFDPSWYLITLISRPALDMQLRKTSAAPNSPASRLSRLRDVVHGLSTSKFIDLDTNVSVFKETKVLESGRQRIGYTNTFTSHYIHNRRQVLLDCASQSSPIDLKKASSLTIKSQVRDLARLLKNVEPNTFALLKCDGVIEVLKEQSTQFEFILEIPEGLHTPRPLRSLLLEGKKCSLTTRVQLATRLARSVMFVHTAGFVHKGVRPETVIVFDQDSSLPDQQNQNASLPFLVGFERFRRAEAHTDLSGDLEWERNLYRHPVRQGLWSEEAFIMQHDIYSLGVCLLEIALWQSFVQINEVSSSPWPDLGIQNAISDKDARRGGFAIKKQLLALAKDRLPCLVGDRYTDIVIACLCCLDESKDNIFEAGSHVKDNDGIIIGVRYIENVLLRMEELTI
ncbi:hypothetical protein PENCOP_c003G04896 [Penicillium coprophilum]|uniref:Protein kinase domain-containing protein n=1 Tax=Penicillium coprophilum TaxID=36646 RepID=A0A1V6UYS1_9EURO|nr:hypothetical protein PENCOP_c003G04896 [Penicillium coprophilum]